MRRVTLEDADVLLEWRNDPATRAASLSTVPVERASHIRWLSRTVGDPRHELYIGEQGDVAVGTVRFDLAPEGVAEVSITVAPLHRGRGLALPLLRAGLEAHANTTKNCRRILARIREENVASRALFASAGFREIDTLGGVLILAWEESPAD